MENEVSIVGFECFSPLGTTFGATWQAMVQNRSGIGCIDRYNPVEQTLSGVAPVVFGGQIPLSYDEMAGSVEGFRRSPEPAHHCVSPVCRQLLKGLGFNIAEHDPQRIALLGATALTSQISQHTLMKTQRPYVNFILNQCHNVPLALVAKEFGLQGPSFTIGGACASGNHALLVADAMIRRGLLDCAIVVGFEFPLLAINAGGFHWLRALYKRDRQDDRAYNDAGVASRPFSVDRRGLLLAEAVGAVLVSDVGYAKRVGWPISAKIRGGYMNSDGDHLTRMALDNVVACMRGALEAAGVVPTTSIVLTPMPLRHLSAMPANSAGCRRCSARGWQSFRWSRINRSLDIRWERPQFSSLWRRSREWHAVSSFRRSTTFPIRNCRKRSFRLKRLHIHIM